MKRYEKYGRRVSWIVIRYGQYGRKASWKVKIYEKYGRKISWIVKRYGKCGRKVSWKVKRYGQYGRKIIACSILKLTMVHGQAFGTITWQSPIESTFYLPAGDTLDSSVGLSPENLLQYTGPG